MTRPHTLTDLRSILTDPSQAVTVLRVADDGTLLEVEITSCTTEVRDPLTGRLLRLDPDPWEAFRRCKLRGRPSLGARPTEAALREVAALFGVGAER